MFLLGINIRRLKYHVKMQTLLKIFTIIAQPTEKLTDRPRPTFVVYPIMILWVYPSVLPSIPDQLAKIDKTLEPLEILHTFLHRLIPTRSSQMCLPNAFFHWLSNTEAKNVKIGNQNFVYQHIFDVNCQLLGAQYHCSVFRPHSTPSNHLCRTLS